MLYLDIDLALIRVILKCSAQFISIAVAVFFSFRILYAQDGRSRPIGLVCISLFIITTSIYDLLTFIDYDYSRQIFIKLDESLFHLRYISSILMRVLLIVAAFGLMSFKRWARFIIMALASFTIITIYWKHPFYVFENIAIMIEQGQLDTLVTELQFPLFPQISMMCFIVADLLIAGFYLFYLTRKNIVSQFKKL